MESERGGGDSGYSRSDSGEGAKEMSCVELEGVCHAGSPLVKCLRAVNCGLLDGTWLA